MTVERIWILGVPIDRLTTAEALDLITNRARDGGPSGVYVVRPYVEFVVAASTDPATLGVLDGAWLSIPDSVGLQWAAAYLSGPRRAALQLPLSLAAIALRRAEVSRVLPERFAGITFTARLLSRAASDGLSVFLVGSPKQRSIAETAAQLQRRFDRLRVVGTCPGEDGPEAEADLLAALRKARPDLVLVGMGFPRQERLVARLAPQLEHGVMIGEGGSFDYREFGGILPRAPRWARRSGLEWLWRLGVEPSRFGRQLSIPKFIAAVHRVASQAPGSRSGN